MAEHAKIEALRRAVPDDPVELAAGHLACWACGIPVVDEKPWRPVFTEEEQKGLPLSQRMPKSVEPMRYGRCPGCAALAEKAAAYVEQRPALVARMGTIAAERIESVLFGYAVLGQSAPEEVGFALPRMHDVAHSVRWARPLTLTVGWANPHPWAHIGLAQRRSLALARSAALRDRLALDEPPVRIPCPSRACLMCGIPSVERSAIEVVRRGAEMVKRDAWTPRGGGHACPDCEAAIQREGAVGAGAMERAVLNHVRATMSDAAARRLRILVRDEAIPSPPPWSALPNPTPNLMPFGHLRQLLSRV